MTSFSLKYLNLVTVLLIAFAACNISKKDNMLKYFSDTRKMVKERKYEEALKRTIWFHDHALEYNKGMTGVRLSFALSDWKKLAEVYPPALDALIAIRDKKTKQVIENADINLFADVAAINRTLNEKEKTIDLFEKISSLKPEVANRFWNYAKRPVFDAKRYDIVRKHIGNPVREFYVLEERYQRNTELFKDRKHGAYFKAYTKNSFVDESIQLIDFSLAVNDEKSAKEIQQKALNVVSDYRLKNALN